MILTITIHFRNTTLDIELENGYVSVYSDRLQYYSLVGYVEYYHNQ